MENLSIREADQFDLPEVLELLRELDLDGDKPMSQAEAMRLFDRIGDYPDYTIYLARKEGEAVGTYALLIMDKLEHGGAPSGIVDSVAVAKAFQGQGIGKAMMRHAMDKCREKGCYKLMLSSNKTREDAHRFYEGLGFHMHGYSYAIDV